MKPGGLLIYLYFFSIAHVPEITNEAVFSRPSGVRSNGSKHAFICPSPEASSAPADANAYLIVTVTTDTTVNDANLPNTHNYLCIMCLRGDFGNVITGKILLEMIA